VTRTHEQELVRLRAAAGHAGAKQLAIHPRRRPGHLPRRLQHVGGEAVEVEEVVSDRVADSASLVEIEDSRQHVLQELRAIPPGVRAATEDDLLP